LAVLIALPAAVATAAGVSFAPGAAFVQAGLAKDAHAAVFGADWDWSWDREVLYRSRDKRPAFLECRHQAPEPRRELPAAALFAALLARFGASATSP